MFAGYKLEIFSADGRTMHVVTVDATQVRSASHDVQTLSGKYAKNPCFTFILIPGLFSGLAATQLTGNHANISFKLVPGIRLQRLVTLNRIICHAAIRLVKIACWVALLYPPMRHTRTRRFRT